MKGLIFVELMTFLERSVGPVVREEIIADAGLSDDVSFTTIGNYPSSRAVALVAQAAENLGQCPDTLCRAFGRYLYTRFEERFPDIMGHYSTARDLLRHVEAHIHEDVRKIYPGANPPRISVSEGEGEYFVKYSSHRPMASVAYGLVEQCIASYNEQSVVEWREENRADRATFVIRSKAPLEDE